MESCHGEVCAGVYPNLTMASPDDILAMYADNPASFFNNPGLDLLRRRPPVDAKNYDAYNPIWDMILGPPQPEDPKAPKPERSLKARGEPVLPSRQFWEDLGAGPAWTDRMGQAQAATMGAGNALMFGVPMAAARRWAPDAARRAQDVIDQNYYAGMAGEIGGAVGNPANVVYRKAGEHLANKGYGLIPQATADAASVAAVHSIPTAIEYGTIAPETVNTLAPVAFWSRMLMPKVPDSIAGRALAGTIGGAVAGSNVGAGSFSPIPEMLLGAVYGAGTKRPKTEKKWENSWDRFTTREKGHNAAIMAGAIGSGVGLTRAGSSMLAGKEEPTQPSTEDMLRHFYGDDSGKP